jgi:PAS domain S-box-containing protein
MNFPDNQLVAKSLRELRSYNIKENAQEEEFIRLTTLAADICEAKISFVTFLGHKSVWFQSDSGPDLRDLLESAALSVHAAHDSQEVQVVPDLKEDSRFVNSSLTGLGMEFYAGVSLVSPTDNVLGTLHILNDSPLQLTERQGKSLKTIGRQVVNLLELRKKTFELEDKSKLLSNLFSINLDLLIEVDPNGLVKNINNAVEKILGFSASDLVRANISDYIHPDDLNNTLKAITRMRKEGMVIKFKCRIKNKKEKYQTIEWQASPFKERFLASGKDITEQLTFEQHLKNSLALNKAITGALDSSTIVSIADLKGDIIRANKVFCQISGYTEEELLGQNHKIINSGYHDKSFWVEMWRTIAKGNTWRGEVCNRAKDGSLYWVDTVINPIYNSSGKIYQYYAIRYLITERKNLQKELRETKQLLEHFGLLSKVGWYEINLVDNTLEWSQVTKEIHEVPEDFVPDRENANLFYKYGESRNKFMGLFTRAVRHGEAFEAELQITTAKGNELWVKVMGKPDMKNDKCQRVYGTIQDINQEKLGQENDIE